MRYCKTHAEERRGLLCAGHVDENKEVEIVRGRNDASALNTAEITLLLRGLRRNTKL
jgi:hypothetical protein